MIAVFVAILIQTTLIVLLASAAVLLFRNASAAARHAVWTTAVLCILVLPLMRSVAPAWKIRPAAAARVALAISGNAVDEAPVSAPANTAPLPRFDWMFVWYGGTAIACARLLLGFLRLRRIARKAQPWPAALHPLPANVRLLATRDIDVPLTFGLFRHVILLPESASDWPHDRLRLILAHEIAHVRRRDCLTQLLAKLACAAYWFQPLAWYAAAQLRKERERACDDIVLSHGAKSSDYAEHLLGIIRSIQTQGASIPMAVSIHSHDLQERLKAVLKPQADRRAASWKLTAAVALIAACVAIPLATMRAQTPSASADISGAVSDASGAVVPRAKVTAIGLDTHNREVAYTGPVGQYEFRNIPAGRYSIEVRAPGFAVSQKEVLLTAGQPVAVNPVLEIGDVSENVDVVAPQPATAQPQPQGIPQRIRVGGNVQATKLVYRVPPVYPQHAAETGIHGVVVLQGVISTDGSLLSLASLSKSADAELVQAARDAVSQWRYQPTLLNGEPVEVVTTITVNFKLESAGQESRPRASAKAANRF